MIDSIYIATSGMLGNERALNVISNNVANLNTAGFRGSNVSFSNVYSGTAQTGSQNNQFVGQQGLGGGGVDATRTLLDMRAGTPQQTGRDLDLSLQGDGFFVLQDSTGSLRYTRNGAFSFNSDGVLVANDTATGQTLNVLSRDSSGNFVPIEVDALKTSPAKATTQVTFQGNLSPTDTKVTAGALTVYDKNGTAHHLSVEFDKGGGTSNPGGPTNPAGSTVWKIEVSEGDLPVGTGTLAFDSTNQVAPGSSPVFMTLTLGGTDLVDISFDFSNVSGSSTGVSGSGSTSSQVSVANQDGYALGTLSSESFDAAGTLNITYTNGQTAKGARLVLAQITDNDGLVELGSALFTYKGNLPVIYREAASDLQVNAQSLEGSNVDLTSEFSTLILAQRGYQGSSQVISTANDMLQQLLDIRNSR